MATAQVTPTHVFVCPNVAQANRLMTHLHALGYDHPAGQWGACVQVGNTVTLTYPTWILEIP